MEPYPQQEPEPQGAPPEDTRARKPLSYLKNRRFQQDSGAVPVAPESEPVPAREPEKAARPWNDSPATASPLTVPATAPAPAPVAAPALGTLVPPTPVR